MLAEDQAVAMELEAAPDEDRSDSDADSFEDGSWEEGRAEDEREPGIGGEDMQWGRSSVSRYVSCLSAGPCTFLSLVWP